MYCIFVQVETANDVAFVMDVERVPASRDERETRGT